MTPRLAFSLLAGAYDGERVQPQAVAGFAVGEVAALGVDLLAGTPSAQPGEVGRQGSGPGIDLVWHIAEDTPSDGASLLAVGAVLRTLVRRARARRPEWRLQAQDPATIGILAATQAWQDPGSV